MMRGIFPGLNCAGDRLDFIDGLRGWSIFLVFVLHGLASVQIPPGSYGIDLFEVTIYPLGYLTFGGIGVSLFFVLSGFVLYLPYVRGQRFSLRRYYASRLLRLYPLLWVSTLVIFIVFVVLTNYRVGVIEIAWVVSGLFMFSDHHHPLVNPPLWSLGFEIAFSILFPFFVLIGRSGWAWLLLALIVIWLISERIEGQLSFFANSPLMMYEFAKALPFFLSGMIVAHAYQRGYFSAYYSVPVFCFGQLAFMASFTIMAAMNGVGMNNELVASSGGAWLQLLLLVGCVATLSSLIVSENKVFAFLFANRFVRMLGMTCYSIYLWHYWPSVLIGLKGWFEFIFVFVFVVMFSVFSYWAFELYPRQAIKVLASWLKGFRH